MLCYGMAYLAMIHLIVQCVHLPIVDQNVTYFNSSCSTSSDSLATRPQTTPTNSTLVNKLVFQRPPKSIAIILRVNTSSAHIINKRPRTTKVIIRTNSLTMVG